MYVAINQTFFLGLSCLAVFHKKKLWDLGIQKKYTIGKVSIKKHIKRQHFQRREYTKAKAEKYYAKIIAKLIARYKH